MTAKPKITFVNPPTPQGRKFTRNIGCASESKGGYLLLCIDFVILSGVLRNHFDISFVDCVGEQLSQKDALDKITQIKPDIIICALIDAIFENDFQFLSHLTTSYQSAKFYVLGDAFIEEDNVKLVSPLVKGIITTPFLLNPDEFLQHSLQDTKEAIQGLRKQDEYQNFTKSPQQAQFPTPKYELFLNDFYQWPFARHPAYLTVSTTWGCPFSCSYCTASSFPFHYREASKVVEDFSYIKKLGVKEVYITDLSFGYPKENTVDFLKQLIEKKLNMSWSTYFHPSRFEPEFMDLMKKAGCHTITIGVETKDLSILKKYGRHLNDDTIKNLISYCKKIGIEVCGDFIIGFKEQNQTEIEESVKYAKELKLDYASFNLLSPLPGSTIRKEAQQRGLIKQVNQGFDSLGQGGILVLGDISEENLRQLRNKAVKSFYLRPHFLLKKVMKIKSFDHFMLQFNEFISLFAKVFKAKK